MKIRSGFVSNSSSSSFVVVLEKRPESPEEIKEVLFKNIESITYYDYVKSTKEISERIFNDIKNFEKNSKYLIENIINGLDEWGWRYEQYKKPDGNIDWAAHDRDYEQHKSDIVIPMVNKFIEKYKDNYMFTTSYDDSGSGIVYEKGNIFKNAVDCLIIDEH